MNISVLRHKYCGEDAVTLSYGQYWSMVYMPNIFKIRVTHSYTVHRCESTRLYGDRNNLCEKNLSESFVSNGEIRCLSLCPEVSVRPKSLDSRQLV